MPSLLNRLSTSLKATRNALSPSGPEISHIPFLDMLAHNWHLGLTSFGGPTVHFQIFQSLFVEKYKWLDNASYQEMFALCQALSGPGSTKMHFAINTLHYNFPIGIAAFLIWSLPMAIASFGLALGVARIDEQLPAPVYALLSGLNAATVGIIALAAVQLSGKAITDVLTRILVFLGAAAGMLYSSLWYFPVLMVAGGTATVVSDLKLLQRFYAKICKKREEENLSEGERRGQEVMERGGNEHPLAPSGLHARTSTAQHPGDTPTSQELPTRESNDTTLPATSWKTGCLIIAAFLASFIIIMACRGAFSQQNRGFDLFANLYLAGTIIFGGGPVVIPLLREYVVAPGWVSSRDFLLGLAITQAFPGPNFNFAVYCGTLAVRGTTLPAVVGAITAFVGIFMPGIWLHFGVMGVWSAVRKVRAVRACLRGVHAAAVGLVFTAVYRLFEIGYLDEQVQNGGSLGRDPWFVVIIGTSFVGGMHFRLSPPLAITLGACMGLIWYGVQRA